jgi:DNA-binding NarL/FixJ family response regulator
MKILLIDDHTLFRDGMRLLLRRLDEGISIMEAGSCQDGLNLAEAAEDLDLVLLDLGLPDMPGAEGLRVLRERRPDIPVVVLSATEDRQTVMQALELGAMGFIPKSSSTEVLLSALRLVLAKGVYIPPSVLAAPSAGTNGPSSGRFGPAVLRTSVSKPSDLGLTERQTDVLALLVQGKPNKIICRELGLAEATVKAHVTAVLKALNVTNRTQAVLAVGRLGLTFGARNKSS